MMKTAGRLFLIIALFLSMSQQGSAQPSEMKKENRMQWFGDARLGIFIHWGIYSVNGIDESWSFFNGYISYDDYMKQLDGFTASGYKPKEWASLIKESGAKYAVLTTKHHDGVALWDSRMSDLTVVKKTPAGHDLVSPFVKALRKEGLKTGLYYSLLDWSHPDYPNHTKEIKRYEKDAAREAAFREFNHGQISEIAEEFNPDLWWFDGDWEQGAEWWDAEGIRSKILANNPAAIINSRLQGYGDYATPEQGLPVKRPAERWWELCMTINDSWGFQHNDSNYKTPVQVVRIFAECLSMGGNMLLDIGPREDGSIPEEQVAVLKEMGRWTGKHGEAVYGTLAGLPDGFYQGPSTLSADSTKLYLFVSGRPAGDQVMLEGIKNRINRIYVVGKGTKLDHKEFLRPYWSNHSGVIFIDLPPEYLDPTMTVICLVLDGKVLCDSE